MDQGEEIVRLLKEIRADQLVSMERQLTALKRQKRYIRLAIAITAILVVAYIVWVIVIFHAH